MGAQGSKSREEEEGWEKDMNLVDFMNIIAARYMLTMNFLDLKNLSNKKYCDKLIILTTKVLKKYLKAREVVYLAEEIQGGVPHFYQRKADLRYLDTARLEPGSGRITQIQKKQLAEEADEELKAELLKRYRGRELRNRRAIYAGGGLSASLGEEGDTTNGSGVSLGMLHRLFGIKRSPQVAPISKRSGKSKTPMVLAELDVQDKGEKAAMCKGIAKFYITIAHLFAAIVGAINPRYIFTDKKGVEHNYSIWNKTKIPRGARPRFMENSLCSRRIMALHSKKEGGVTTVNIGRVCSLNRQLEVLTEKTAPMVFSRHGEQIEKTRGLSNQIGIPSLEKLYDDDYSLKEGKFVGRKPGGPGQLAYEADLKKFYEAFTGKKDYRSWNASRTKRFGDVPLQAYHKGEMCQGKNGAWKKNYKGSGQLFDKYGAHLRTMRESAEAYHQELLGILKNVFALVNVPDLEDKNIVSLQPGLTEPKLRVEVDKARETIIKLYIQCEKDFQSAINIVKAIIDVQTVKGALRKAKALDIAEEKAATLPPSTDLERTTRDLLSELVNQGGAALH